ncbi:two-component system, NtrC family, response regulator HydG [Pustulibacterium marinum]|uniref:Two-component system, NtrC family, response regulator HydG n=1 Tax=Pustulibacterium marinum TaxID=1224947 RepID=A0A1I7EWN2_9FLAO|nr:sigma-54 dependent transcriptional regulator [Pustulibacterium marinum]SFU28358.1 two-component system, NtrC family, response regulator HydG [Pustulibacterium marinum]
MAKILIVDDDITFSSLLERFLSRYKHQVTVCHSIEEATPFISKKFDLVFLDLRLPDGDGITFLDVIQEKVAHLPVVIMTNYAEVASAVNAMKKGAFDYISKPFNQEAVLDVITNVTKSSSKNNTKESSKEVATPTIKPSENTGANNTSQFIKGIGSASKQLSEYIKLVAPTDMSVLITGESGTGKEVVAKSIHTQSKRKDFPFVAVDCGAIPKEIASSEFFGHVKGSFTGAVTDKKGHFEEANGGTIFLDEVGNLSYDNQIQLLRALQERKIKPVGSSKEISVDIRVLAATNEDLLEAVEKGQFREDLYHRLHEFSIKVPPLVERMEDLMIFADYFLEKANQQLGRSLIGFSNDAMAVMQQYHWPGNLRELQNVIKRSALLSQGDYISGAALPPELSTPKPTPSSNFSSFSKQDNEKELIISVLKKANNNKTLAAKLLNVSRKTLYNKLKTYGLDS